MVALVLLVSTEHLYAQEQGSRHGSAPGSDANDRVTVSEAAAPDGNGGVGDAPARGGAAASEQGPAPGPQAHDESGYRFSREGEGAAQDTGATAAQGDQTDGAGSMGAFGVGDLLRMLLVLLMVVGAVYGAISFLRRRVKPGVEEDDSPIRVLASRNIGGNRELYVVMIGRQVLVIGGGDASLQLVTTVDDQETIDELLLSASASKTATNDKPRTFGAVLSKWVSNVAVPGSGAPVDGEATQIQSFLNMQHSRLRKMR